MLCGKENHKCPDCELPDCPLSGASLFSYSSFFSFNFGVVLLLYTPNYADKSNNWRAKSYVNTDQFAPSFYPSRLDSIAVGLC